MQYKKYGAMKRVLIKAKYIKPKQTTQEKRIEDLIIEIKD